MNVNKLTFEIRELPSGWLNERTGHVYKTAADVIRAANRAGRQATTADSITVTKIVWTPRTALGRQIIAAVTAK
jgi:hypothetical protein